MENQAQFSGLTEQFHMSVSKLETLAKKVDGNRSLIDESRIKDIEKRENTLSSLEKS